MSWCLPPFLWALMKNVMNIMLKKDLMWEQTPGASVRKGRLQRQGTLSGMNTKTQTMLGQGFLSVEGLNPQSPQWFKSKLILFFISDYNIITRGNRIISVENDYTQQDDFNLCDGNSPQLRKKPGRAMFDFCHVLRASLRSVGRTDP